MNKDELKNASARAAYLAREARERAAALADEAAEAAVLAEAAEIEAAEAERRFKSTENPVKTYTVYIRHLSTIQVEARTEDEAIELAISEPDKGEIETLDIQVTEESGNE